MFNPLITQVNTAFEQVADAKKAQAMATYMKNKFAFYGISSAERRAIAKQIIRQNGLPSIEELSQFVQDGFSLPQREMHYFTVELAEKFIKKVPAGFIEQVREQAVTHSWWDTVDMVATKQAGGLVRRFPKLVHFMDEWIQSENMWLRRTAILHQLKYKQATDEDRLFEYCLRCADSKEFFIQKAIGWALREYSKTAPEMVIRFIQNNELAPLSKREGLKWEVARQKK